VRKQLFHPGCLDCSLLPPSRSSDAQCRVPSACSRRTSLWSIWCGLQVALSAPTSNVGVNLFLQCVLLNFCCANIPQSLSAVVARCFGTFTTSTEGRSIAPRCRRHFLSHVTDQPLFLLSSSPLLEHVVYLPFTCRISCILCNNWGYK